MSQNLVSPVSFVSHSRETQARAHAVLAIAAVPAQPVQVYSGWVFVTLWSHIHVDHNIDIAVAATAHIGVITNMKTIAQPLQS